MLKYKFLRLLLKSALFILLILPTITTNTKAMGISASCSHPIPSGTYVFCVSQQGVLAYRPIESKGCAGFACRLYRSLRLGMEFSPVTAFSSVNAIFAGPVAVGVGSGTGATAFVWAQRNGESKFALYATADAGATWRKVPDTETRNPCSPYRVIPDILNPAKAYLFPVPSGEAAIPLRHFWETRDGGRTWQSRSLPGKIPPADGFFFNPADLRKIWVWCGSMGNWTGVQYSEDGGLTWQPLKILAENRIYGAILNPYTGEIIVTGRKVISRWYKGKGEDLRGKGGISEKTDFVAGPPILDPLQKEVLVPVFKYEEKGGVSGAVYSCRSGEVEKIAVVPPIHGDPVYAFLSEGRLYLSFVNFEGPGQVLEYALLRQTAPHLWLGVGVGVALLCGGFLLLREWKVKKRRRD